MADEANIARTAKVVTKGATTLRAGNLRAKQAVMEDLLE
jgi:hypothetical protein